MSRHAVPAAAAVAGSAAAGSAASPMDLTEILPSLERFPARVETNAITALASPRVGYPPISPSARRSSSSDPHAPAADASSDSATKAREFAAGLDHLKHMFAAGTPPPPLIAEGAGRIEELMRVCTEPEWRHELLCVLPDLVKLHPLLCTVLVMRRDIFLKACLKWANQFAKALSAPNRYAITPLQLLMQLLLLLEQLPSTAAMYDSLAANAAHPTFRPPPSYLHHDPRVRDGKRLKEVRDMFLELQAGLAPEGSVVEFLQQPECRLAPAMVESLLDNIAVIVRQWKQFDARKWWRKLEPHTAMQGANSSGSGSSSSSAASASPQLILDTQSPAAAAPSVLLSPTASDAEDLEAAPASGFGDVDRETIDGPMHLSHHPAHSSDAAASASASPAAKKPRRGTANVNLPRINGAWKEEPLVISSDDEESAEQDAEIYKRPISPRAASQAAAAAAAAAASGTPQSAGSKRKRVEISTSENTVRRYDPNTFSFVDDPNFRLKSILKGSSAAAAAAGTIMSPPRARLSKSVSDSAVECRGSAAASASAACAAPSPASILPARYAHSDSAALFRDVLSLPALSPEVTSQLLGGYIPALQQCMPINATQQARFAPGGSGRGAMAPVDLTRAFTQGILPCLALHPSGHRWLPHWSLLFSHLGRVQELHYQVTAHLAKGRNGPGSANPIAPLPPLGTMLAFVMDPLYGRHWTEEFVMNRPVEFTTILDIAKGNLTYEAAEAAAAAGVAAAAAGMQANSSSAAAAAGAGVPSPAASPRAANGATVAAAAAASPSFITAYAATAGAPEPHSPVPQFGPQDHGDQPISRRRKRY